MKSISDAQREMLACFRPLPAQRVPLLQARGRVLTQDLLASVDLPPFDNSAMDGYAVRHADLQPGALLDVRGESRAGGGSPPPLEPGAAMRIFTGAPMPAGADTVVIQENTARAGERVRIASHGARGQHVRARATDQRAGDVALSAGTEIGPGEIALLAAQGHHHVDVHRAPRVAILCTGDELRDIGQATEPGTIVNSNAYALAAQVEASGGEAWVLPPARDALEDIAAHLQAALAADVVLSIGGVSVGAYDLVGDAMARVGITTRFHKVAIKPGKPILFATAADDTPVVGLPGNPVSAMVTFEVFVRPGLLRMLGHADPYPAPIRVSLAEAHRHASGRTELARARLAQRDGRTVARLHPLQGSGSLPSMVGVDALLVLPAEQERFEPGTELWALPLRREARQRQPPIP